MRAETDAIVRDLAQSAEAKNLKSARVGEQRARPAHKPVQPAHAPDGLVAGTQVEMIGVAQYDLRAQRFEHVLRNGLDAPRRAHRHKDRSLHSAVRQMHPPPPPAGLGCCAYLKFKAHQTILPGVPAVVWETHNRAESDFRTFEQAGQQLCDTHFSTGHKRLRRNLAKWYKHKRPLRQPGMRNSEV